MVDKVVVVREDDFMTKEIKKVHELPETQQRALYAILQLRKDSFNTSDVVKKIEYFVEGKAAGAVLGALYRNGYLDKVQGGRDKRWILSKQAEAVRDEIRQQISDVKMYWS
ncbi:MAG: hypothetical protein A3E37_02765 [Candidatus Andersenbacteria bacterium RIFCSPHIGHO2_12_FULL_46_9]|nr:MAG: hypothetical protein UW94_C0007G0040 [Parcubacteria group bacterium GW2011_GWA2_45_14]OGY33035.1 MAG: hypothetical protein A3B76_01320 [Candidatus Andersenbacteria bacterium RIFCSPHIGHO2_02_FULL_46_16]OGY36522.1 MAG: hypothetical protein A3E37_02765 [Candidatus Andersenbacteria bacterium RIFCSPHIGHO2_12_FULL_46_9]OGY37124.1 MAG: hypothetical protein A3I08_02060 [Candidatus Andersenbacteria bacterium RIFCSPLOWO2_02_FULL_46_11]HBE90786.1 hypothetical protein [Candidatus Andersenbacteria b